MIKRGDQGKVDKGQFADAVKEGLKDLRLTYGMAFTRLESDGNQLQIPLKKMTSLIQNYEHLRYIDFSNNNFESVEFLAKLPNLITLILKNNSLHNLNSFSKENEDSEESLPRWPELKFLDLSNNKINEVNKIRAPKLKELLLPGNDMRKIESFEGCESLEKLDLSHNQIQDVSKIENLNKLTYLYLGNNRIKSFLTFEGLESLKFLHMRNNYVSQQVDDH